MNVHDDVESAETTPQTPTSVRIGTSRSPTRLRDDGNLLDVIELAASGARPLRLATAQRWRAETPERVEFTLRASRTITHGPAASPHRRRRGGNADLASAGGFRDTPSVRKAWKETLELVHALDTRIVIFQTPSSFRGTDENVARVLRFFQWAHRDRLRLGWEPRGVTWTDGIVRELCRELSLIHVVDPFTRASRRPRPAYYRLPGVGGPGHRYTDEELAELRGMCRGETTYCIFRNAAATDDARRFAALNG